MPFFKKYLKSLRDKATAHYKSDIISLIAEGFSQSDPKLLDLGCNDGVWTTQLCKGFSSPSLYGIEVVESQRKKAQILGIDAKSGDLNHELPFESEYFDIVHANQVIEHLADTDCFIEEIFRVLKPGGFTIICTENLAGWHNIFSLFFGWQPFSLTNVCVKRFQIGNPIALHNHEPSQSPKSWLHTRVFSYRGLKEVFECHGFEVEKILGAGYYPLPTFFAKIDPRHGAFLTVKAVKPIS